MVAWSINVGPTARARKAEAAASKIELSGKSVILTGTFSRGTMREVKAQLERGGARLVGDVDSPLYGLASPTEKQCKAEALNDRGASIQIVAEAALPSEARNKSRNRSRAGSTASRTRAPKAETRDASTIPTANPKVDVVHQGEADYLYQLAVSGDRLLVCGMHGSRRILASQDGRSFDQLDLPDGPGLRCIATAGRWVWAAGNRQALVSSDHGKSFRGVSRRRESKGSSRRSSGPRSWRSARPAIGAWDRSRRTWT
jgi:hypothetical protein